MKEIIDAIERGEVAESWKVIVAVPKEREFKRENVRFFGKMTPELRLYQVVTEENIASNIFKYIKQQSMTMSEDELIRTILKLNAHARKEDTLDFVFIVIDFSSWCSKFRYELASPVFHELDNLYGLKGVSSLTSFPWNVYNSFKIDLVPLNRILEPSYLLQDPDVNTP